MGIVSKSMATELVQHCPRSYSLEDDVHRPPSEYSRKIRASTKKVGVLSARIKRIHEYKRQLMNILPRG